jgi:hypothetical protein
MQTTPALSPQPPRNWSGVVVLRPQWVQTQVLPSGSVPLAVQMCIGLSMPHEEPVVVDTEQLFEPVPLKRSASFVQ